MPLGVGGGNAPGIDDQAGSLLGSAEGRIERRAIEPPPAAGNLTRFAGLRPELWITIKSGGPRIDPKRFFGLAPSPNTPESARFNQVRPEWEIGLVID